ncbi:DUF4397 domain-containing protein [Mucilaginibacter celer]|uniref:DUF4397 domain-containing protein n=1 Tax=Mucilaginibacter celer TaxID=2305508 RepID=A0A494VK93_9SPHI|nr:DUF4397 domain-containing protein [Mucilaginibacter celer]AYL93841.1 DUF4397 domain-containing protein [Mucilaginibacter celer]
MKKITSVFTKLQPVVLVWFMATALCLTACKKNKMDLRNDNRFTTTPMPVSTSRIVNLAGFNQVRANGRAITDSVFHDPDGPDYYKFTGTDYFPKNGLMGATWQIQQALFASPNGLELKFSYVGKAGFTPVPFTMPAIKEEYNKPMDYYLLPTNAAGSLPNYYAVERGAVQPSKPDHFKIRIINLTAPVSGTIFSPIGQLEDLTGPVTLTYADGTPVAAQTSNVTTDQHVSDYLELPYGAYQFKVLTANGRQVPGASPSDSRFMDIYPTTSTVAVIANGVINNSKLTFAPINTYQPGGVYTIVVTPYNFNYDRSPSEASSGAFQNAFTVITDLSAPANITYCRVQAVNALPGDNQVSFRVNGQALSAGLGFGQSSAYSNLIQGDYNIEAVNASGTVLASLKQTLKASQNYTAWLYPDAAGKSQLLLVPNDLSGLSTVVAGNPQDASAGTYRSDYLFNTRCLNLSPDNQYITFTFDNGQPAAANLRPGILNPGNPYVNQGIADFYKPFELMAYRSLPDVVPGTWAKDIEVFKSENFIANPALYTTPARALPAAEPGIYTAALIGRSGANVPVAEKAKIILVKHNR